LRGGDVSAEEIESTPDQRGRVPAGKAVAAGWSDFLVRCLGVVSEYAVRQWISRVPVDLADIKRDNREFLDA
jgi:4,5-dihydroxyphthalate decarboxylase